MFLMKYRKARRKRSPFLSVALQKDRVPRIALHLGQRVLLGNLHSLFGAVGCVAISAPVKILLRSVLSVKRNVSVLSASGSRYPNEAIQLVGPS